MDPHATRSEVTTRLEGLTALGSFDPMATGTVSLLVEPTDSEQYIVVSDRGGNVTRVRVDVPFPGGTPDADTGPTVSKPT